MNKDTHMLQQNPRRTLYSVLHVWVIQGSATPCITTFQLGVWPYVNTYVWSWWSALNRKRSLDFHSFFIDTSTSCMPWGAMGCAKKVGFVNRSRVNGPLTKCSFALKLIDLVTVFILVLYKSSETVPIHYWKPFRCSRRGSSICVWIMSSCHRDCLRKITE